MKVRQQVVNIYKLSDAPLVDHDATTVPADDPSRESLDPNEETREPMHLNRDDLRGEDQTTSVSALRKDYPD